MLFARCPDSLAARRFVALRRRLKLQSKVNDIAHDIWGTLQKPKEVKARNRRLIKLAEYMQRFLAPEIKQQENWKCVCWRTGTVILKDRRACRVTHAGGDIYDLTFFEQW